MRAARLRKVHLEGIRRVVSIFQKGHYVDAATSCTSVLRTNVLPLARYFTLQGLSLEGDSVPLGPPASMFSLLREARVPEKKKSVHRYM